MARAKGLSKADLRLWAAFTEDISLLPGRARLVPEAEPVNISQAEPGKENQAEPGNKSLAESVAVNSPKVKAGLGEIGVNQVPGGLDKSTWKNFASGKIKAVRRLDLHGMTAMRAHVAVMNFVERAYGEQIRCVEIITGKGEVLARELPHWLNSPGVRARILAVAHSHVLNTGSVRVLLRRVRGA